MFDVGDPPLEAPARRLGPYWLATTEMAPFAGGIGVYAHQTARMLAARGVAVTVLHHDGRAGPPEVSTQDGYRLIRFGAQTLDRRDMPAPNLQGPLRASAHTATFVQDLMAHEGAPDVLEAQDYGALAHGVLKARLMAPERTWPRVALTAHRPLIHCAETDGDSVYDHRTAFIGDAERWCYAAADAVFAPCAFIVDALTRAPMGFDLSRARMVRNPVDAAAIRAAPQALERAAERIALARSLHTPAEPLLYFGKLQAQKGAADLLAALSALAAEDRAPPLWMFGRDAFLSGTPTTAVDALSERHDALIRRDLMRYFGGYGLPTMRSLCVGHPVAVFPYREDCLPYAVIEAVICGALPLTSANGGQAELFPERLRARLTVDFIRPDALDAALRALRSLSPAERREMSQALVAEVVRQTDPEAVFAAKLEALAGVRPRTDARDYPFAYGPSLTFETLPPETRRSLTHAIAQRGATLHAAHAGPALRPSGGADLISVVIPYYEMQAHVAETLAAVEAQSHDAIEVILVDDGSPSPAARDALRALLAAPRRFPTQVLRKYNGGLADARNAGAKAARGAYLYFLDPDDTIHPATLGRSLAVLRRYPNVGYVGASLKEFGASENEWTVWDVDGPYIAFHNLQICAFLVRAEAWLRHGVNDADMRQGMEDWDSHVRMMAAGVRGVALPERYFNYRMRTGSMSHRFDPHAKAHLYRRILRNTPGLFRRFGPELVGMASESGHGALAPSPSIVSEAGAALFRRDIPSLGAVASDLERTASRAKLGQALRARCDSGDPEWDYTAARLLMALDREPAFARDLLGEAVRRRPENGWFRLYAILARLRAGRIARAEDLWTADFDAFCEAEAGAVDWAVDLEAVRGFPHAAHVFTALRADRAGQSAPTTVDVMTAASPFEREVDPRFTTLRQALSALRASPDRHARSASEAVRAAAAPLVSHEASAALLARWAAVWGHGPAPLDTRSVIWGADASAYRGAALSEALRADGLDPEEAADARRWLAVASGGRRRRQPAFASTALRRLWTT